MTLGNRLVLLDLTPRTFDSSARKGGRYREFFRDGEVPYNREMPEHDPYVEFALVYDDWQYLYPQPFALTLRPRIVGLIEEFPIPARVYADLGCGTGLFPAWFRGRYPEWRVLGVDRSEAMIAQARETATRGAQKRALLEWGLSTRSLRATSFDEMMAAAEAYQAGTGRAGAQSVEAHETGEPSPGKHPTAAPLPPEPDAPPRRRDPSREPGSPSRSGVEFFVQPLAALDLPAPVGLATCLFDGINHVTRLPELEASFGAIHDALLPGGVFAFDLVHEDVFAEAFDGAVLRKGPGLMVAADSICFHRGETLFGRTTFSIFRQEGTAWQRYEAEITERCWQRSEIRHALDHAGLDLLRQDDIDPAREPEFQLPRSFWVCRRPLERGRP